MVWFKHSHLGTRVCVGCATWPVLSSCFLLQCGLPERNCGSNNHSKTKAMAMAALHYASPFALLQQSPQLSRHQHLPILFLCHTRRFSTDHVCSMLYCSPSSSLRRRLTAPAATSQTADAPAYFQGSRPNAPLQLTYLEGNSWLWNVSGLQILVDPVLVGNLDFGIPWFYDASKKELKEFKLEDLPEIDLLLITQSYDDHCHVRTLKPLSKMFPNLQVISTPNAESILNELFKKVVYLEPGAETEFIGKNGIKLWVRASAGPILGPPWQRPENGYFVKAKDPPFSVYYEPHCVYDSSVLQKEKADIVITPVTKQVLPAYTLVSGLQDAVDLIKILQAKVVVPMQNGDLDSKGILAKVVSTVGTVEEFKDLLQKDSVNARVVEAKPGIPVDVMVEV